MKQSTDTEMRVLPETGFLRIKQLLVFIPVSRSTWWRGVKEGRFPKPVKLGCCTFWKAEDIHALLEKISRGEAV